MKPYLIVTSLFLSAIFLSSQGWADAIPVPYHVKVWTREIKNRVVESTVRGHSVRIDQPESFGADDTAPTPPEYLAVALGSCVVSTMRFTAMREKVDISNIAVNVEGWIDFSNAMGLTGPNRSGFSGLTVTVDFDSPLSPVEKQAFMKKVMDRGAAIDNIIHPTEVTVKPKI